ncbi:sensor histidine kinase [Galbitalea sp. SE-J8]|uniref:sensor histidine kinase n=1 Tax=Galbitalea sp. SE-J8 TaxID=3054952 RepID=UPI00259CD21A|nr:sensor histidine kinase [Galbitalea sp. SE-J8]MDM4762455.1 sensor histidine kinase [Galbitalea sp. SE-J8]
MTEARGWTVAVAVVAAVCVGVLLAIQPDGWRIALGASAAAALVTGWLLVGRRSTEDSAGAIAFIVIVVVASAAITYAHPSLATVQCIAFPLVWTQLDRRTGILVANLALATSVGVAMAVSYPPDASSIAQAVVIELISLGFSLAFGAWISGMARQSEERRRLLDELRASQEAVAALHREAGVTAERERLARDLHDTVAQDLAGVVLLAQRARREVGRELAADAAGAPETAGPLATLDLLEEAARAALGETRALVAATASPGLEGGIGAALGRLAARFERETGIRVSVDAERVDTALDRDAEVVLLRCAQEALANVRSHAGAASVALRVTADAGVELTVADDGHGFDASAVSTGFGLPGMRERLALVHGSLAVASGDRGTTLSIRLPGAAS